MDLTTVADNASGIHADDSAIYLFGSELYCGWCLESFRCPVRLKIHCHIEHLATCSCGERYRDRETLCRHVARSGCCLPAPFEWSHFVKLPLSEDSAVCSNHTVEDRTQNRSLDGDETTDEKRSDRYGVFLDGTQKIDITTKRELLLKKHEHKDNKQPCLQALKQQKFCCELCPFQCKYRSWLTRHILKEHKNVQKSISVNSYDGTSTSSEDCSAVENDAVTGTVPEAFCKDVDTLESAIAGKSGQMNPAMRSSDVSKKLCYKEHSSDDIPFLVCYFSLSLDSKLLCCDLCDDEFGEWKEAAMHVYNSHLSALEQWRDSQKDSSNKSHINEDTCDEKSATSAADHRLKQLHSAEPCDVPKSMNRVSDRDNGDVQLNVTEYSSANSDGNSRDNLVDTFAIPLGENKMKRKFTTDESSTVAASLYRLFHSQNFEPEVENPILVTHSSSAKCAVPMPVISKKSQSPSKAKPVKEASSDMVAAMQWISRKCKFCHRVCSTRSNCQRHEAVCYRILLKSKHSIQAIRKIRGSDIFYCSRCGYSDSDQHVVNEHLMEPHTVNNKRLHVKSQPGHDYIGSMRLVTGNFQCTLCGLCRPSRSKMLMHLHRHSSVAAVPESTCNAHPASTAIKMKERAKEQSSRSYSSRCARSCPNCFRSFSSVANYLSHRAVCQATQHHQRIRQRGSVCKYNYLFNFCKQASDGRWKCKLCEQHFHYRGDLYKHIRGKHNQVPNTKLEARCLWKELSKKTGSGRWLCRLCKHCFACCSSVYKHIRVKHAAELNKNQDIAKLNDISGFCEQTSDGQFQCTLCKCLKNNHSCLLRHIHTVHFKVFHPVTEKLSTMSSCSTTTLSSSSVQKQAIKSTNTAKLSSLQKSQWMHFVKPCPNCSHVFTRKSSYQNHVKWCYRHDRFMERISSGKVRCRLCNSAFSSHVRCVSHLRRKHLLTGKSIYSTHNSAGIPVSEGTGHRMLTDGSVSANNTNNECSDDSILDKTIARMEH